MTRVEEIEKLALELTLHDLKTVDSRRGIRPETPTWNFDPTSNFDLR